MTRLKGKERATYVQQMFTQIAKRYDLMNRLMTGGQDIRWRKRVIELARLKSASRLLDLGTATIIAADFTLEMMRVGQKNGPLNFSTADALRLPFSDFSFDAVVSGFLMRNVIDLQQALREQHRVLKKGGRIVILDTTRPKKNILSPFIWLYMHLIIPTLGGLLTGAKEAYRYLPETTEGFVTAEDMASRMAAVSFKKIGYERLMFGTIAIHWAEK
jgi:demethylmenaquinone methyltransferase/2-methoxy-6-polyprenyl-1,4-benzoquinol methylase